MCICDTAAWTSPGRGKRTTKTAKDVSSPHHQPKDNSLSYVGNQIYVVGRVYCASVRNITRVAPYISPRPIRCVHKQLRGSNSNSLLNEHDIERVFSAARSRTKKSVFQATWASYLSQHWSGPMSRSLNFITVIFRVPLMSQVYQICIFYQSKFKPTCLTALRVSYCIFFPLICWVTEDHERLNIFSF